MTVVKFSILTLLAGGFCTLLGIGMWMGPQDTPCSAQTGTTAVAAARSAASCKSCWSAPSDATTSGDIVACEAKRCESACEPDACDLVASSAAEEPAEWAPCEVPPHVPRIPAASFAAYAPASPCESGVCPPPGVSVAHLPPGAACPPPAYAPAPVYHVAPCTAQECTPPAYPMPYGAVPANVYPAPVISTYATYREVEPRSNDQPSMEMIEAFMEEREKRYEAQIEALEAVTELKLEAQAAMLKAEHEAAMAKLHAEAYVKLAGMEQALREEKALLQLVADGTLPTESLRAILARNHANGHGSPVQTVSTAAAGCACEKCACEPCKCGQAGASCVCAECKCEGCACPGCEQAISTAAPACTPCEASACRTSACETKACGTSACKASACSEKDDCKACEATTVVSAEACDKCAKSCDLCVEACGGCKVVGDTLKCDTLTVSAGGKTCSIVWGGEVLPNARGECVGGRCTIIAGGTCDKSVAVETVESPFVCEKDGCEAEFRVGDMPILSKLPYIDRLFDNAKIGEGSEPAGAAEEAKR